MTRAKFKPNRTFPTEIERDAMVRRGLGLVASEIAKRAANAMPRGFMGTKARTSASGPNVYSGPGWHLIEFGSIRSSPRAVFRRTVEGGGMKLGRSR
jgi:hypothetical protein